MESKKVEFFNKLSFTTLLATVFISIFFFIPYVPVTLEASKGFLISVGATLALFFWLIARLGEGKFSFPKDKLLIAGAAIPVVFLLSSFFSSSKYVSLFGSGFELGTFGSMLVLFIIFFLSSIYFQTEKRIWSFFLALLIGGAVIALFEVINMFVGFGRFAPGMLKGISSGNLVGSWTDFAILSGLLVLVSLATIEFLRTKGFLLVVQYFLIVTGLFFLIVINVPLVWVLVSLFSIIMFVYSISIQQAGVKVVHTDEGKKKFPFASLIVIFVCLIFLVGNSSIGNLISRYLSVQNIDVHPMASTTAQIAYKAIKHNPLFGTGPNTFNIDWALWQPKEVVQSVFWNVDFSNGFSSLMTFAATTGILGILAWLYFLFNFVLRVIRSLRKALSNSMSNYFTMTTILTAVYSWIIVAVYTPNFLMFAIAFMSTGVLLGILVYNQSIPSKHFSFLGDPRNSFFSILGLMVLMIVTLSTTYLYAEKFASIIYFSKGSVSTSNSIESLSKSERMMSNALLLDKNDIYYRSLSQIYIAEIGALINDKNISEDTLKTNVQKLVNAAEGAANSAVAQNPKQYQNYLNLGNIYTALVPLQVSNSYESAVTAYDKAKALAPNNPSIILARATLEFNKKNNDEAKKFIDQALELKADYTDAIFLLAQIQTSEGNLAGAIKQAEKASNLSPNDSSVFFRLGLLRYNNSDYTGAISAFERAVILDPQYLNAHFLLGQSYQKVGRIEDARAQFNAIAKVLPDNKDVKDALESLTKAPTTDSKNTNNTKNAKTPLPGQR